jgi:mRNA interferase HigB
MNVINRAAIRQAQTRHPGCRDWLDEWWHVARRSQWTSLQDVRQLYSSADEVGSCLVFDAPGARRLIVGIYYSRANASDSGTIYIKHFLTHAEYDKDSWKKDC